MVNKSELKMAEAMILDGAEMLGLTVEPCEPYIPHQSCYQLLLTGQNRYIFCVDINSIPNTPPKRHKVATVYGRFDNKTTLPVPYNGKRNFHYLVSENLVAAVLHFFTELKSAGITK